MLMIQVKFTEDKKFVFSSNTDKATSKESSFITNYGLMMSISYLKEKTSYVSKEIYVKFVIKENLIDFQIM